MDKFAIDSLDVSQTVRFLAENRTVFSTDKHGPIFCVSDYLFERGRNCHFFCKKSDSLGMLKSECVLVEAKPV